jgi:hypothetical protein
MPCLMTQSLSLFYPLPPQLNVAPFLYLTVTTRLISHPTAAMPSLIQHQKSTKHCPCPCCDPSDSHKALLDARLAPIDKYSCSECRRRFAQKPSLEAHQRESLHASATTAASSLLRDCYAHYTCNRTTLSQRWRHLSRPNSCAATASAI